MRSRHTALLVFAAPLVPCLRIAVADRVRLLGQLDECVSARGVSFLATWRAHARSMLFRAWRSAKFSLPVSDRGLPVLPSSRARSGHAVTAG